MTFWPIAKIAAELESRSGADPSGPSTDLAIADFLINSWFLDLRVHDGAATLFVEGSKEELQSLSALAKRTIEASDSLPVL